MVSVYAPACFGVNGCEYETPKPGAIVVVPSGPATEMSYQLVMWFAVSVIESSVVTAAPSAGSSR